MLDARGIGNGDTGWQATDGDVAGNVQEDFCQLEGMSRRHDFGEVVVDSAMEERKSRPKT